MPNPSIKNEPMYRALRRQGMSKARAARISNAARFKAATLGTLDAYVSASDYAPPVAQALASLIPELPAFKGERLGPGITRIRGNLCNVHGRYGPCDAAQSGKKPPRGKKPAKTPEQRQAERQAARSQQQQANRASVASALAEADASLGPTGVASVLAAMDGQPITNGPALETLGYAEKNPDGSYRLTPEARALARAASAGDARAALDADGRAQTRAAKLAADAEKKREEKKPKGGGGGGGGGKPDKATEAATNRASVGKQLGLNLDALNTAATGGRVNDADRAALTKRGLLADDGQPTDAAQQLLAAADTGDTRAAQAALVGQARQAATAAERQQQQAARDADRQQRRADTAGRRAETDRRRAAADRRQLRAERRAAARAENAAQGLRKRRHKESNYGLDTGTGRTTAQGAVAGAVVFQGVRTRHDGTQSTHANRQTGRIARQGTTATATTRQRIKAFTPSRVLNEGHTGVMVALYPDAAAVKAISAQPGVSESPEQMHLTLAFLGDSSETPLASNKNKVIAAIAEWAARHDQVLKGTINGLGRFFHSEDDGTNAVFVSPDVPKLPELRQSLVDWIERSGFDYAQTHGFMPHITVAYVQEDAPTPDIRVETLVSFDRVTLAWGDEQYEFPFARRRTTSLRRKSFAVYKAADGTPRWLARSTTAYRDRDGEILSVAALDADSQRMTATKQFGPLRWWHVGLPDAGHPAAPWGPGLDLGWCDFSTVIGRTRVESGTFKSTAIARAVARVADTLELSPGFFHPPAQPDAGGVFAQIRTFERSLVPTRYARASNLFTGLTVKEHRMDPNEIDKRFKAAITELGLSADQAAQLGQQIAQTDKAAQAAGIAYKSQDAPMVYTGPDGVPGIIRDGLFVALKAAAVPPALEAAIEEEKAPEEEVAAALEETPDDEYAPAIGDMSPDEFGAMLDARLAPLIKALDIAGKMGGHMDELKSMMTGVATKEAGLAAELATLKAQLAELAGDAPRAIQGGYRASQTAATVVPDGDARLKAAPAGDPIMQSFGGFLSDLGLASPGA